MKKWLPLAALLLASTAHAQKPEEHGRPVDGGSAGRMADRLRERDAELGITTRDGKLSLLLTGDALTMQLTDRALREIHRDMDSKASEKDDGSLGRLISSAVRSSVESVLDHGWQYDLEDIQDVRYDGSRLVITDCDGHTVLENVRIDDGNAMEGFSPEDARRFAKEFRRLKERQWI